MFNIPLMACLLLKKKRNDYNVPKPIRKQFWLKLVIIIMQNRDLLS